MFQSTAALEPDFASSQQKRAGGPLLSAEVILVTPEMAERWLNNNPDNRREHAPTVARIRKSILSGEWRLNGETIKIQVNGSILDGQHRLRAILESGIAVQSLVVTGLPRECFDTIDQGKSRSIADCLSVDNVAHYTTVASALRWILKIRRKAVYARNDITTSEAITFFADHPLVMRSVNYVMEYQVSSLLANGAAASLHYEMQSRDVVLADDMFKRLGLGCDLEVLQPTHTLREKLLRAARMKAERVFTHEKMAWAIKAWNLERQGMQSKTIRWSQNTTESFPEIK